VSSADRADSAGPRRDGGFTMIEMLIALVIMALMTTALFKLVQTQSRIAAYQSQTEDAQENGRATIDVLTGDLRAVTPTGIISARDSAIVMALPKAWGVLCATSTATTLTAAFPAMATDAFTVLANGGTGVMVNTSGTTTPTWAPRPTLDGNRPRVTARANGACAGTAGSVNTYTFTGTNFPVANAGTLMMLYQLVRYDVGSSESKYWVRRSNGLSGDNVFSMTPLAGPLPAADSLRFTYYQRAAGSLVNPEPGTNTAILDSLTRVKVKVVTISSSSYGTNGYSRNRDSATVQLRNRSRSLSCAQGVTGC